MQKISLQRLLELFWLEKIKVEFHQLKLSIGEFFAIKDV